MIKDIYSRKILGWEVRDREFGELAAQLLQRSVMREQCFKKPLVLHSDNGAPMKSVTLNAKMEEPGMTSSHSRPRVSNDNPYSKSYYPRWLFDGFEGLDATGAWFKEFVALYSNEHCHSQIKFVTPAQRHNGEDKLIIKKREATYQVAKAKKPNRWSGQTRNWDHIQAVELNPPKPTVEAVKSAA
jgi:putative transposase